MKQYLTSGIVFSAFILSTLFFQTSESQNLQHEILITEVFANTETTRNNTGINNSACAGKSQFTSNQYIEIYNPSASESANLQGYLVSDGTASDEIVPWNNNFHGNFNNNILVKNENSWLLPPNSYALILDPDYAKCDQIMNPHFPKEVYLFTLKTSAVPGLQGFGQGGLQNNESVLLFDSTGNKVAEFAGSFAASDAGEMNSWERRDNRPQAIGLPDSIGEWQLSQVNASITPGYANSVQFQQLSFSELMLTSLKENNEGLFDSRCTGLSKAQSDKYIEIKNNSSLPFDLSGVSIHWNGTASNLAPWRQNILGIPKTKLNGNSNAAKVEIIANNLILPANSNGLILDPDYAICDSSLEFPQSSEIGSTMKIFVFTVGMQRLQNQILPTSTSFNINVAESAATAAEPIFLKNKFGKIYDSFLFLGNYQGKKSIWNSLPEKPSSLGYLFNSIPEKSIERKIFPICASFNECEEAKFDAENWQLSSEYEQATPGFENSIQETNLVFSEVMSFLPSEFNTKYVGQLPALRRSQTHEYIELWNSGVQPVNLSHFSVGNGKDEEEIVPWNFGEIASQQVASGSLVLQPGKFLLILDSDYALRGDSTYNIPKGTLVAALPTGLGTTGMSATDALTLYDGLGLPIATFGTPYLSTRQEYYKGVNNSFDSFPSVTGTNRSWEKKNLHGNDTPENWESSTDHKQHSPGAKNTVSEGMDFEVNFSNTTKFPTVSAKLNSKENIQHLIIHNISEGNFGNINLDFYEEVSQTDFESFALSANAKFVQRAIQCPSANAIFTKFDVNQYLQFASLKDLVFLPQNLLQLTKETQTTANLFNPIGTFNRKKMLLPLQNSMSNQFQNGEKVNVKCASGSWQFQNVPKGMLKLRVSRSSATSVSYKNSYQQQIQLPYLPHLSSFVGNLILENGAENSTNLQFSTSPKE